LGVALARLKEALAEPPTNILHVDGTIQRFEFVFELFWKTLKHCLQDELGVFASNPRDVLRRAFEQRWIDGEAVWMQMLKDRNETSHIYDEEAALRIYGRIKHHLPELERVYVFLVNHIGNPQGREQGGESP